MICLDEVLRQQEFPITRAWTYLDHATFGPFPRATVAAMDRVSKSLSEGVLGDALSTASMVGSVRESAARLLRAPVEHIALLRSTGEGINLVASGLEWRKGDEVIAYERDFPGTLAPWRQLQDRGVVVRLIPDRGDHTFSCDDVLERITARTRAVCLSLIQFDTGFRAPVEDIAEVCRRREIWFVVDAAQAMGVLRIDAPALGADIVAAHGYKFLLSGFGLGICYCSPRAIEHLRVPQVGWKGGPGAARFEPSMPSLSNLAAMSASLDLLLDAGIDAIENRVLDSATAIADGMRARGWLLPSLPGRQRSALVSARHPSLDVDAVRMALLRNRVVVAVREGFLRISPHAYSTPDDVHRFLANLPA